MKKQAINLGRVGILLPLGIVIPFLGPLAGLAALILLLMSHYYFSKFYESPKIFKKSLMGVIIPVVANFIGVIILVIAAGSALISISGSNMGTPDFKQITSLIFESGATIVGALIILAGSIIGYYFFFQALKILADKSGVKLFRTAGLLYFIGAIGILIFFIGILVMIAAWIVHIVAYFSLNNVEDVAGETAAGAEQPV